MAIAATNRYLNTKNTSFPLWSSGFGDFPSGEPILPMTECAGTVLETSNNFIEVKAGQDG
jgi:hypothetical protein